MTRLSEIISSSLRMAMQELWKNKLRTFLSLFGVTIGIFCIIGVMTVVSSLQQNIQNEIQTLGSNTIYVDKWDYTAGGIDYPWWKYVNRPLPRYADVKQIKERTHSASFAALRIRANDKIEANGLVLSGINLYGISEDFDKIQPVEIEAGRYISDADFNIGNNFSVIGFVIAEKLFGQSQAALNKEITVRGKRIRVGGVMKKQGRQLIGGWNFDESILLSYGFAKTMMNEWRADPVILVKGKEGINSKELKDDLFGSMRAIHKLSPTQTEDFALNDVNDLSQTVNEAFVGLNIGGAIIGGISLIVGLFGVANIMFVTVRERTSQIGLKKAIGAKNYLILTEFLLESAFLCLLGGLIGLTLVFALSFVLSSLLAFPIFVSVTQMALTVIICLVVGVLAGIVPAIQAAKMDPVVAIRSK